MTKTDREIVLTSLYNSVSEAKLEMEAGMDCLIEKGLTKKMSAPLLEIMELTLRLLRESD